MGAEHRSERDDLTALIRASGLDVAADELEQVIALHNHFARDRATLAAVDVRQTEPAPAFRATWQDDQR